MLLFSVEVKIGVLQIRSFIIFVPVRTSFFRGITNYKYLDYDNLRLEIQALEKIMQTLILKNVPSLTCNTCMHTLGKSGNSR